MKLDSEGLRELVGLFENAPLLLCDLHSGMHFKQRQHKQLHETYFLLALRSYLRVYA